MKNMKKNNKHMISGGFTLIEVLSAIVLLFIISGIGIYVALNIINNIKNNSYQVSINNIEKSAESYSFENPNKFTWLNLDNEGDKYYLCVKVQDLIDYGYFKSDVLDSYVSKDKKVDGNQQVYLEKDGNNETITKSILLIDNDNQSEYMELCKVNTGRVDFKVEPIDWSQYKYVDITYTLINNKDYVSEYKYMYYYKDKNGKVTDVNNLDAVDNKFTGNPMTVENIKVIENGTMYGYIVDKDGAKSEEYKIDINNIDIERPVINNGYEIKNEFDKNVVDKVVFPIEITDIGSGYDGNSFTVDDVVVTVGGVPITDGIYLTKKDYNKYDLEINSSIYGEIKVVIGDNKVLDKAENGNKSVVFDEGVRFVRLIMIKYDANGGLVGDASYGSSGAYTYNVPYYGKYLLEVWGAQGGAGMVNGVSKYTGGYGGYSVGNIELNKDEELYIYVGGKGGDAEDKEEGGIGGFNGGGAGGLDGNPAKSKNEPGAGGGGATHISLKDGLLSTLSLDVDKILIVAGGGGGAAYYGDGGSGGGIEGHIGAKKGGVVGTQTSGYAFGLGADGKEYNGGTGGGGGGFYGGSSKSSSSYNGTGGSGYIGNGRLTNKSMYCYKCTTSTDASTLTNSQRKRLNFLRNNFLI